MPIRCLLAVALLPVFSPPFAAAQTTGENSAHFVRALLGSRTWSRVVRVVNERPVPAYPADFHAVVFEVEGMLWFYVETDGTQGLSRHAGRLAEDRRDYRQLVRELWPGFVRVEDVTGKSPPLHVLVNSPLPRGCFLHCLLQWRQLQADRRGLREGRLLTFYVGTPEGAERGHTVLVYEAGGRMAVYDPAATVVERWLEDFPRTADPLDFARWFAPRHGYQPPQAASFLELHRGHRRVSTPRLTLSAAPRQLGAAAAR